MKGVSSSAKSSASVREEKGEGWNKGNRTDCERSAFRFRLSAFRPLGSSGRRTQIANEQPAVAGRETGPNASRRADPL
jgi:hypothetical protein